MSSAPPASRTVLIVDDDLSLLDALERAFVEAGEEALARGSFEEGRQALRERRFDVLLTDVRLGAFNGLQLAVLARDLWPDIRLLVFSGYDDPVLRAEAEHVGATYLVKPVSSVTLLEMVRR
jgi:DNA-binding NtrC family response regulator